MNCMINMGSWFMKCKCVCIHSPIPSSSDRYRCHLLTTAPYQFLFSFICSHICPANGQVVDAAGYDNYTERWCIKQRSQLPAVTKWFLYVASFLWLASQISNSD
jgi:hypothetical protein